MRNPAVPRARMGDARRDLGRAHDSRGRAWATPRRACGASSRRSASYTDRARSSRRASRSSARFSGPDRSSFKGTLLQLRRGLLPLGHGDGAAAATAELAADLGRVEPAARRRQADREDADDHGARLRPHHPARRRLDDLLQGAAPGGADRADRLSDRGGRRAAGATSTTTRSPTR